MLNTILVPIKFGPGFLYQILSTAPGFYTFWPRWIILFLEYTTELYTINVSSLTQNKYEMSYIGTR